MKIMNMHGVDKYEQMDIYLKIRDLKLEEKQKELDQALKERDDFKVKLEKWSNASVLQNEVLNKQRYVSDKSCIGFGIESSNSMESDISSGDETLTDSAYENFKREKAYKAVPPPTDWVDSDDEETDVTESQKETVFNSENSEESFKNRSPNSQNRVGQESRIKGLGNKGVLTRDGLISTARPKMTQTVPSKSTAKVTYQGTARSRVPQAVLSRSTDGSYYPRMDNRRPRISSYSPSSRSSTTRTPHRSYRPKKIVKSIWVKTGSYWHHREKKISVYSYAINDSGKGNLKTSCVDFEKVAMWKELKFKSSYLFIKSVTRSTMVLFTDTECLYSIPNKFKFVDEDLVILRAPRKNDVYSLDLKNIIPSGGITCLVAKATEDEAVLWHRRLGHVNFKNINKLVKGNLVRGLPSKTFKLDHSCLACRKGKQHRASCKKIEERTVREPLELLHMDLFGPVSVESVNRKKYCLVVTDDCSKFSWVFFLAYKDETYDMLHDLIVGLENRLYIRHKRDAPYSVTWNRSSRIINTMNEVSCAKIGYSREEYSIAKELLTNGVAERKNKSFGYVKFDGKSEEGYLLGILYNSQRSLESISRIHKGKEREEENYVIPKRTRKISCDDVEDLDDQQFIVHTAQPMHSEERTAAKDSYYCPLQNKLYCCSLRIALDKGKDVLTKITTKISKPACLLVSYLRGTQESLSAFSREVRAESDAKKTASIQVQEMDVKSAFYMATSQKSVCQYQPTGFERSWLIQTRSTELSRHLYGHCISPKELVYVDDIIFGSTKSSMVKDFEELMQKEFKMSSMGELTFFLGLQVKQTSAGIFLSQDKYVKDILNKFDFRTIKPASTPIEAHKSLGKDEEGEDVDVHLYRSMIGCLMYLTASRPDIMFAVCLCARFQVTPKVSHLHAVKRIFRLVSWQCKKQTIVAISSTEAEYVAAASCCAQVLWMQNQLLDYGFNFMNTEIHIDNESTICIVRNPVLHSKTKHIQIRHHFIRDCYEQRLINVVKVHTDDNVADLLTKGFDLARFNFLVVTIGMMNP
ncbi:putative ribonuclease H-like domain-containing protein [Tanacetum coccineum]|uniref:Ribonuclease H-like domain-containing protein n=1 Tax=Tanacetum coccineum TaxID=301880 RepID=A0ABQ5FUV5_9ASTR